MPEYNPFINAPAYTNALPDESALLSPAYRNPFFFRQEGQLPAQPYYNPFQGAFKNAPPVVQAPVAVAPEVVRQGATQLVASDDNGGSHEAVQGGWTTSDEVTAAIESGWYGTYNDAKNAKGNPKANAFTDIVDKAFADRGAKADPFAIDPNYGKINPTGILSGLGRIAQELGLSNAYGSGAIGTNDPVIGKDPNATQHYATNYQTDYTKGEDLGSAAGAVGSSGDLGGAYSGTQESTSDNSGYNSDNDESYSDSGYSDSIDTGGFNDGGPVMYRNEGSLGPEGINPALGDALATQAPAPTPAPVAPAPMPAPMPARMSFADKVAKAKSVIEQNKAAGESLPTPAPMMTDAEGDGGVMGDVTYADHSVGPDMGSDTVDAKLTPGEFVMNKEATEMYGPEIEQMNQQGLIARAKGGPVYKRDGGYNPDANSMSYSPSRGAIDANNLRRAIADANTPEEADLLLNDLMSLINDLRGYDEGGYVEKLKYLMDNDPENAEMWGKIQTKYFQDGTEEPVGYQPPAGALNKLGQSLVSIGQRDFTGASDALTPDAVDKTSKSSKVKQDKEILDLKAIGNGIIEAAKLVPSAVNAINETISIGGKADGVATAASVAGANFAAVAEARNNYLRRHLVNQVNKGELDEADFVAYEQLSQRILRLAQRILNTQTGTKTDFDAQNAAAQIANLTGTVESILGNFKVALDDVNLSLTNLNQPTIPWIGNSIAPKTGKPKTLVAPTDAELLDDESAIIGDGNATGSSWRDKYNEIKKILGE